MMEMEERMLQAMRNALDDMDPADKKNVFLGLIYPEIVTSLRPAPTQDQLSALGSFTWDVTHGKNWRRCVLRLAERIRESQNDELQRPGAGGAPRNHEGASGSSVEDVGTGGTADVS